MWSTVTGWPCCPDDNAVDVTINELAPTGLEPLVFQHVLPINCEPSVMVPAAPVDAALPTDSTTVVDHQQQHATMS